jgi:two-component system probable response regulator PhcQ
MSTDPSPFDYQRYAILFVDDEANTRKYFRRLFREKFRILEAEDGVQALKVFHEHADEIGIIVTDQRMPNETGIGFLSKISDQYPDIIKILSTAYTDIDAAIGSVNQGGVFRYMTKPWDIPQLEITLRRAMEFFVVKRERDALLKTKMETVGNVQLASRLASFALAPVCAGISCNRVAEALASFVRSGVGGLQPETTGGADLSAPDWAELHSGQIQLATSLGVELSPALAKAGLAKRIQSLASLLESAGATGITSTVKDSTTRLSCLLDPTPALLDVLVGRNQEAAATQATAQVLAAYMAVYDAGGQIRRVQGEGLILEIDQVKSPADLTQPGAEAAKWLYEDHELLAAALGLRG